MTSGLGRRVDLGVTAIDAYSVGKLSRERLMSLAAVQPANCTDPVHLALAAKVRQDRPDLRVATVADGELDPARPDRRYSLARVREFAGSEGAIRDLMVMRGDLEAVMAAARASREDRTILRRQAQMARMRGCRALGVASARVAPDGTLGPYRMQGFVTLKPTTARGFAEDAAARPGEWVRINVWSALLRWQHWINAALIFTLSCTGYYVMDPFFGPSYFEGVQTGYLMGWVRLIHFLAAFTWLAIGATRVILAFASRDRYMRWPTFWPLKKPKDVRNPGRVAAYYLFARKHAPLYLAHNPLQQLAYTGIYALGFLQMLTGLNLYALYHRESAVWALLALPASWIGVPALRLIHTLIMFVMWAFVIAHVYLAIRADSIERHGGVSSMVNGGVWLRRGSKPEDAPEVG